MDLVQQNYPEGYRISYSAEHHTFQIYVKSELSKRILLRLGQWGSQLANHKSSGLNIDHFSNHSASWGYGSCMHMVTVNEIWDIWECVLSPDIQVMDTNHREKAVGNIACSLSVLFDSLNACMRELPILDPSSIEPIQIASVTTYVVNRALLGAPIGSSLSRKGRGALEKITTSHSTQERKRFYTNIINSMVDVYRIVDPDQETHLNQDIVHLNRYGASQDLLSVGLYGDWRIHFECVGASLCVIPIYDAIGEERGADLEPHNTDLMNWQMVLLAGLCACYQQLFPILEP